MSDIVTQLEPVMEFFRQKISECHELIARTRYDFNVSIGNSDHDRMWSCIEEIQMLHRVSKVLGDIVNDRNLPERVTDVREWLQNRIDACKIPIGYNHTAYVYELAEYKISIDANAYLAKIFEEATV